MNCMRFARPLLLLLLAIPGPGHAAECVDGRVAVREDGGQARPLPGVTVSDGRQVVESDAAGRWELQAPLAGPVFVVKPAGHAVPVRADGLPGFWRAGDGDGCDFELLATDDGGDSSSQTLEVLVFSDPQTSDLRQVGYYRDAIVAPLADGHGADLGVTLGDVTNDDPSLYPAL